MTYIPQAAPLGLAHAVLIAADYLGDDDFVMYLGDNFIVGGISALVDEFRRPPPGGPDHADPGEQPARVRRRRAGRGRHGDRAGGEAAHPKSGLALVGVYIFTPDVHEAVRHLVPSGRGELEITEALQWLIDNGHKVRSTIISGYWKDTGNVADMLEVNRMVLEGVEALQQGAVDDASELIGRVVVETGAQVSRSRIVAPP